MSSNLLVNQSKRKLSVIGHQLSKALITARKRSLRRLCFYRCLSVHREGGRAWLLPGGACVVAPGGAGGTWLLLGGQWLLQGACVVAPGGVCVVAWGGVHGCSGGCTWLLQGGMHGCSWGACVVAPGGGACMVALGGHAWFFR